jgi:diguanylate cyclase
VVGVSIDKDRAAAFAHAAFAQMAEYDVPPTPENFELWYTYTSGEDVGLKQAIDRVIANGTPFDENILQLLRERFFGRENHEEVVADIGDKVNYEIDALLRMLEVAGNDHSAYGRALSEASGELHGRMDDTDIKPMVDRLVHATRAMEARSKILEQQLQNSHREVSDLRERLETARQESLTDQLTGIANRKAFDTALKACMINAREAKEPLCLIMCDIDHFKLFNDTWGHQTGDQVLKLVANCLAENVKGRDTAARYGGEEFAIILPQTSLSDAMHLADQIRMKVEGKKLVKKSTGDILGTISISCGVASFRSGESTSGFVQRADAGLYAAKSSGRNCVVSGEDLPHRETVAA